MTDREHRIDTGSPEERVKAKWPDAKVCRDFFYVAIVDGDHLLSYPYHTNESEAWADAASRLETK